VWPSNWNASTQVNILLHWTGLYDDANNMQFTAAFSCPVGAATLNYTGNLTFGAATNSPVLTNGSHYYSTTVANVTVPVACTAGTLGVLQIGRNNSVTGTNSTDALSMVGAAIQWTSH
jgi:hypothetical protein